jgi:hypothetical protein
MRYIRIKNRGLIEPQALHLVGASTKRNDSSKIGMFGSGNKYALAYFLRNKYELKIFSGINEIKIETKKEYFREMEWDIIYINGEKTSITTEMGKDWQFWQAIREIYCNAMDEGDFSMDFVQNISPVEGETHFYIDTKKDVTEFVNNFDNYFSTNKKILFECPSGRILEKSGTTANIYRKGVRCFNTNKTSIFDYDFTDITIDENRLIRYFWESEEKMWNLIYQCTNKEVIMSILHNCADRNNIEGCLSDISTINASNASKEFKECLKEINMAPSGMAGMLKPDEVNNHIIVPTKVFNSVRAYIPEENVGDKFKVTRKGAMFREIEISPLYKATLDQAMYFFSECSMNIDFPISIAIFDNKEVLGAAHEGQIILSDICLEKGVNEVVNTIVEEFIHLKYKVADETRDFQTSIITEFISYMKKINSFVI